MGAINVDRVVHWQGKWTRLTETDETGCAGSGQTHFCFAKVTWHSVTCGDRQVFRACFDGLNFFNVRVTTCWGRRYPRVLHVFVETDEHSKIEVEATERLF